ncbi:MAG TPA: hypothetical protein V6C72_02835, partial [Chroococcales cyanobacterium]
MLSILVLFLCCLAKFTPAGAAEEEVQTDSPPAIDFTLTELKSAAAVQSETSQSEDWKFRKHTYLTQQRIAELFASMPGLQKPPLKQFVIPERSLIRPPLPGIHTTERFPPDRPNLGRQKATVAAENLKVTMDQSGPADEMKQVTFSFSQPMVAVGKADDSPASPIELNPQPRGKWRWAGTQTLIFEPEGGLFP